VILNIDTLILYHEVFIQRGRFRIEKLIDDYNAKINLETRIDYSKRKEDILLDTFEPFSNFVDKVMDMRERKPPAFIFYYVRDSYDIKKKPQHQPC